MRVDDPYLSSSSMATTTVQDSGAVQPSVESARGVVTNGVPKIETIQPGQRAEY